MRGLIRIYIFTIIAILFINLFSNFNNVFAAIVNDQRPVKASVLLRYPEDPFNAMLKESLEKVQKENEGKIEFTFYDSKNDQLVQERILNGILQEDNTDIILLNLIDPKATKNIIDKIKEKNIPVGFFNIEEPNMDAVRSYSKAYFVGTRPEEAGILQGEMLINLWNNNKESIDRNNDNVMQYIMLMGNKDTLEAIGRTKYSVSTINDEGIKTEELALRVCNWEESVAKDTMDGLILQYSDKIEVIISNNDAMAIGAIEALQKYGYNKAGNNRKITVVGVDAIPEAQELIKAGIMTGTVVQDPYSMAKAVYEIGINLVNNRAPLDGTEYKFDDTGVSVRIPYNDYIVTSN